MRRNKVAQSQSDVGTPSRPLDNEEQEAVFRKLHDEMERDNKRFGLLIMLLGALILAVEGFWVFLYVDRVPTPILVCTGCIVLNGATVSFHDVRLMMGNSHSKLVILFKLLCVGLTGLFYGYWPLQQKDEIVLFHFLMAFGFVGLVFYASKSGVQSQDGLAKLEGLRYDLKSA